MSDVARGAKFEFEVTGISEELMVVGFEAREMLSAPFEVDVRLASYDDVDLTAVLGNGATLRIHWEDRDDERCFNGIVNSVSYAGAVGKYYLYRVRVVPKLWLLSCSSKWRVFEQMKVSDIAQRLLQEYGMKGTVAASDVAREHCIQYRETDLEFFSRLLEEEGFYYRFDHDKNSHDIVIAKGTANGYPPIPGDASVPFVPPKGAVPDEECVFGFSLSRRIRPQEFVHSAYNFEKPGVKPEGKYGLPLSHGLGKGESAPKLPKQTVYDYPAKYLFEKSDQVGPLARVRMEELAASAVLAEGRGVVMRFSPGRAFRLTDAGKLADREYLITSVTHTGQQPQVLRESLPGEEGAESGYSNAFTAIPADYAFRPPRSTRRAPVRGIQTAVVVSAPDEYGRVKVKYHWPTNDPAVESVSYVRVAQPWAGGGWGTLFTPRVGDEVVLDFLDGDIDLPVIVGSLYNKDNPALYPLDKEPEKTTIKTRTYPDGSGFNEIRFDDAKGKEELFIHAERDRNEVTKNDVTITVGGTHTETIEKDTKITITSGTFSHDVAAGTAAYHVQGDVTETYDGAQTTTVAREIKITSSGASIVLSAAAGITLSAGASKVVLKADGSVSIEGVNLAINGAASVNIKGTSVTSEAAADHNTKGAIVVSEGTATNTIKGGMVMLNP